MTSLNTKKADFTKGLLIDAACELAETLEVAELSFKTVSEQAGISQRTMFRHFQTREEFLNALTERLYSQLKLPELPDDVDGLLDYIAELYQKLDRQPRKVVLLLSADLLPRVLETTAKERLMSLKQLLSRAFPKASKSDIEKTAANLRYVMSASSWRYYRISFGFDLATSIDCVSLVVSQGLDYLRKKQ